MTPLEKTEIKRIERILMEKHPNWPVGKARWAAEAAFGLWN